MRNEEIGLVWLRSEMEEIIVLENHHWKAIRQSDKIIIEGGKGRTESISSSIWDDIEQESGDPEGYQGLMKNWAVL